MTPRRPRAYGHDNGAALTAVSLGGPPGGGGFRISADLRRSPDPQLFPGVSMTVPASPLSLFAGVATSVAAAAGLAGCASYVGAPVAKIAINVVPARGFTVRGPVAVQEPLGLRFHGAVCPSGYGRSSTQIRVERLTSEGDVVDVATRSVWLHRSRRERACSFFNVTTKWTLHPGERAQICAGSFGQACSRTGL